MINGLHHYPIGVEVFLMIGVCKIPQEYYNLELSGALPSLSLKNEKNYSENKFFIFQEMKLSSINTKKVLIFLEVKPYISQSQTQNFSLKKFLYFLLKNQL